MGFSGVGEKPEQSGFSAISARIAEFLHVFDLTFLVTGFTGVLALREMVGRDALDQQLPESGVQSAVVALLVCYVLGLLLFAFGREISSRSYRKSVLVTEMKRSMAAHPELPRLNGADNDALSAHYSRMWQSAVADDTIRPNVAHLMRAWAMAATYDALGFAFVLWAVVPWINLQSPRIAASASAGAVLVAHLCWLRGAAYFRSQVQDIVSLAEVSRMRTS